MQRTVVLALGANVSGPFGAPLSSLRHSVSRLSYCGLSLISVSGIYRTAPIGGAKQPSYFNAVAIFRCPHPPRRLLRILKQIESDFGRRRRGLNRPRPLDLDIIDATWPTVGWLRRIKRMDRPKSRGGSPSRERTTKGSLRLGSLRHRPHLMLPHPEAHRRRFVLEPLLEIAPHWYHRGLRCSGRNLLARLPRRPGEIERTLDSLLQS